GAVALAPLERSPRHGRGDRSANERGSPGEQLHQSIRWHHGFPPCRLHDDCIHRTALGTVAGAALMPPLRILHVIPSVSTRDGGPSQAIGVMERALSEAGVEVTTLTTDHDLASHCVAGASVAVNGAKRIYAHKWLHPYKVAPNLVPHLMRAVKTHDVM